MVKVDSLSYDVDVDNTDHKEADESLKKCLISLKTEEFHNLVKEKLLDKGKMTFQVALQQREELAYVFPRRYNSKAAKAVITEYPSFATDAFFKAVECRISGEYERAKVLYEILIDSDPCYPNTLMTRVHINQNTCSWNETETKHLMKMTELQLLCGETPIVTPHQVFTYLPFPRELCLEVAKKYAADVQSDLKMHQRGPTMEVEEDCCKTTKKINFPVPKTEKDKVLNPRIRLGYVSSDFKDHSLSHLIEGIFSCHDRHEFEVYCYALNEDDGSEFRKRIEKDADVFRDISSEEELLTIKDIIQADKIDIHINLNGYTRGSRNEIFAARPAPIQIMWLGFPGTSGSKYMDHIFTDKVTTPHILSDYFTENIIHLKDSHFVGDHAVLFPHLAKKIIVLQDEKFVDNNVVINGSDLDSVRGACEIKEVEIVCSPIDGVRNTGTETVKYETVVLPDLYGSNFVRKDAACTKGQANGDLFKMIGKEKRFTSLVTSRSQYGIPINTMVYCNFCQPYKIDERTLSMWLKILERVPSSVLWLLRLKDPEYGPSAEKNVHDFFQKAGVDDKRIIFTDYSEKEEYIRFNQLADIFLDTPLVNAHTTGLDSLWAGTPIVTLQGEKMASRIAASFLVTMGCRQLVAKSERQYIEIAVELGKNKKYLESVRARIYKCRKSSSLFNNLLFVKNLELELLEIWKNYLISQQEYFTALNKCKGNKDEAVIAKDKLETDSSKSLEDNENVHTASASSPAPAESTASTSTPTASASSPAPAESTASTSTPSFPDLEKPSLPSPPPLSSDSDISDDITVPCPANKTNISDFDGEPQYRSSMGLDQSEEGTFSVSHAGKNDVKKHGQTLVHSKAEKSELHCSSVSVSDTFSKAVKVMFPDSDIAKKFQCGKTKTTQIVKGALDPDVRKPVIEKCRKQPFSLAIDESNDRGDDKLLVILIRLFDFEVGRSVTRLLDMPVCNAGTGAAIFDTLNTVLSENDIPWNNLVAFTSDNCNTMIGKNNSVLSRVREKNPYVYAHRCVCHMANLCASAGVKTLPISIDELLTDIYFHFDQSTKRKELDKEFLEFTEDEPTKLLKQVSTRWLSLQKCINRTLDHYPALKSYFESRSDVERQGPARRVANLLTDPSTIMYLRFLSFNLAALNEFNTTFQADDSRLGHMATEVQHILRKYLKRFVRSQVIREAGDVRYIAYDDTSNQLRDDIIAVGQTTRTYIREHEDDLTVDQLTKFFRSVRAFYEATTKEMLKHFPFDDPVLQDSSFLVPTSWDEIEQDAVVRLGRRFPGIIHPEDLDQLEEEYRDLQVLATNMLPDYAQDTKLDEYWGKLASMKNKVTGKSRFPTLTRLACALLTIQTAMLTVREHLVV